MKVSLLNRNGFSILMLLTAGIILFQSTSVFAAPRLPSYPGYISPLTMEGENSEYNILQTLARLRQALTQDYDLENFSSADPVKVKRIRPDLGMDRGYSGKLQNSHLIGKYYGELRGRKRRNAIISKRGLDLGLGRGFSGSQAAKHLMGLAAANFAGGPGRRRRSEDDA